MYLNGLIKDYTGFIIDNKKGFLLQKVLIDMNVQISTQQPPTTAKVIMYTSHGQIDLQLWAKQTPLASKNFIQHCLQGYYINTIFHRLIPGFMIQGGDPSGTGMGGQSIYDGPFKDEFHQRLKFTKRGILAMANSGKNTNQSQFFITFGPCEHLNKKHTIFGKVVGDTIYNLMALQSLDTAEQDKPLDPPIIRKTKVIEHPFTDIQFKSNEKKQIENQITAKYQVQLKNEESFQKENRNKKQELKKLKNKKKLTFQNEEQEDEAIVSKVISSHQVLYKKDPGLSNKMAITKEQLQIKKKQKQLQQQKSLSLKSLINFSENNQLEKIDEKGNKQVERYIQIKRAQYDRNQIGQDINQKNDLLNYIKRYNPITNKYEIVFQDQLDKERMERQKKQEIERKAKQQQEISDKKLRQVREMQLSQYNLLKADELNFKKAKQGSLKQKRKQIIHEEKKLLSNLQKHRFEFTQKQKINQNQGQLFKKLQDFTSRLKSIKNTSITSHQLQDQKQRQFESSYGQSNNLKIWWMNHKLKFHIDSANAYSLQEKGMKVNKSSFQDEDDGGLKMEICQNDQDDQHQHNYDQLLKDL